MRENYRWGILGCGVIASYFIEGLQHCEGAELTTVAGRTPGKAKALAEKYNVPVALEDYRELVQRDDVDIVYIATTHNFHYDNAVLCLENGKAVLCEKPVCINAKQMKKLKALAAEKKLFFMEAMWTRFLPTTRLLLEKLKEGIIGEVQFLQANFAIDNDWSPQSRMRNPDLAGGAILDLGIYPITFSRLLFGADPQSIQGCWVPDSETGVDELSTYQLQYPGGQIAQLMSGYKLQMPHRAFIYGTEGHIEMIDFFHTHGFTVYKKDKEPREIRAPFESTGYQHEAAEVQRCLEAGLLESPLCPLDETISILETMDELRQSFGLRYEEEKLIDK